MQRQAAESPLNYHKDGAGKKSMVMAAQFKLPPQTHVSGQIFKDALMKPPISRMIGMVHNVDIDTK